MTGSLGCFVLGLCLQAPAGVQTVAPAVQGGAAAVAPAPTPVEPAKSAAVPAGEGPIQDNSFLLEEAYNQEPGVIQHISTMQRDLQGGGWYYTFTQEWPIPRQRHQFSVTLSALRADGSTDGGAGVGDTALNYRFQLSGSGETRLAIAPRVSLMLSTGDHRQGRGAGGVGVQFNFPVSVVLGPKVVTHVNAGVTLVPHAKNADGDTASISGWNAGESFVWLATPTVNPLIEVAYTRWQSVVGPGATAATETVYVSPGIRFAINFKNGLQVVPGIAVPLGVGPSAGQRAVFLYLSFEHPAFHVR